jgi:hypothetical protein
LKVYQKAPQATDFFTRQKVVLSLENNKKKVFWLLWKRRSTGSLRKRGIQK